MRLPGLGPGAEHHLRPGLFGQVPMSRYEIGVHMGFQDVLQAVPLVLEYGQVQVDVPLGIDDSRLPRVFVSQEIGSMGQAIEIELLEYHRTPWDISLRKMIRPNVKVRKARAVLRPCPGILPPRDCPSRTPAMDREVKSRMEGQFQG